jgi:hypothetical protein
LQDWISKQNFDYPIPAHELHCTIILDKENSFPYVPSVYDPPLKIDPSTYEFDLFGSNNDTLVLKFECPQMAKTHRQLKKKYDIPWDYDEYSSHITLAYSADKIPDAMIDFPLLFEKEYHHPYTSGHKEKIKFNEEASNKEWVNIKTGQIIPVNSEYHTDDVFLNPQKYQIETFDGTPFEEYANGHKSSGLISDDEDIYEFMFSNGWVRVFTEEWNIAMEGLNLRSIRKACKILHDAGIYVTGLLIDTFNNEFRGRVYGNDLELFLKRGSIPRRRFVETKKLVHLK